jgi:hypothetical protein
MASAVPQALMPANPATVVTTSRNIFRVARMGVLLD